MLVIIFLIGPAASWVKPEHTILSKANAGILKLAGAKCTFIAVHSGREFIKNTCNSCRSVGVTRKRPGISVPVVRRYIVQAASQLALPFRGPGRTRITKELTCKGNSDSQTFNQNPQRSLPKQASTKCVMLKPFSKNEVILANFCNSCRSVGLERLNANGLSLGEQAFRVSSRQAIRIKRRAASQIKITSQIQCKN